MGCLWNKLSCPIFAGFLGGTQLSCPTVRPVDRFQRILRSHPFPNISVGTWCTVDCYGDVGEGGSGTISAEITWCADVGGGETMVSVACKMKVWWKIRTPEPSQVSCWAISYAWRLVCLSLGPLFWSSCPNLTPSSGEKWTQHGESKGKFKGLWVLFSIYKIYTDTNIFIYENT